MDGPKRIDDEKAYIMAGGLIAWFWISQPHNQFHTRAPLCDLLKALPTPFQVRRPQSRPLKVPLQPPLPHREH